jgi:hypothetical protein
MHTFTSTLLLYLALVATASPLAIERTTSIIAADILKIAPEASTCANCPAPGECRTASQAAPYIAISFTNFGITSFNTQAALLSLMLYESASFKYAKNHFPGVPGQGTRNMQSPEYNLKYAQWLATMCKNCGITQAEIKQAQAQGPAAVLALVNTDEWSFGSAAWFLSTQCDPSVKEGLAAGTQQGWETFLTGCVQTTVNAKRTAIWKKAIALKAW